MKWTHSVSTKEIQTTRQGSPIANLTRMQNPPLFKLPTLHCFICWTKICIFYSLVWATILLKLQLPSCNCFKVLAPWTPCMTTATETYSVPWTTTNTTASICKASWAGRSTPTVSWPPWSPPDWPPLSPPQPTAPSPPLTVTMYCQTRRRGSWPQCELWQKQTC